ncbi:IS3 family transposase [Schaalia sp. Marseille-Q2122]|uniref:IS3 family transposase n=1 Tax=Schaalia sp. Marseille-Q2122 TaxID=2736604 RepID=UPI001588C115|nr:IS3 family transposase [Schaalia sp. Marseille-Q2122]
MILIKNFAPRCGGIRFAHPCHGFRRAHAYLVHDVGMEINLKKIQRLWREEGLTRKTPRKEVRRGITTTPQVKATCPNHVWSIDFQYGVTRDGHAVKIVPMFDEFTRVSLIDMIERSVDADALAKALSALFALRGTLR